MASAFDGIGMGMLGSEKRFMSQDNPLSTAFKGLKDYGILRGMEKTGLFDYLNKIGEEKQAMMDKYPGMTGAKKAPAGAVAPSGDDYASWDTAAPAISGAAAPAADNSAIADNNQNPLITDQAAENLFKNTSEAQPGTVINKVLPASTFTPKAATPPPVVGGAQISGVSPDVMQPRNMGQDQLAMDVAVAQPPPLNLPQYGKQSGGGGGSALSALSSLFTLFA
jgi:hypothetical protein